MEEKVTCKYCHSEAVVKYGSYKGVPRYWCKVCERKFKADDTTFHMKTDANLVSSSLSMYYEGMPVRAIRRHLQQEFNHTPSTATIYEWVQKYTQYATDSVKEYHPNVGNVWIADETVLDIEGQQLWLWDIIDNKTRFLLATRLSRSRTTRDAQMLIDRAVAVAGKHPKTVVTDKLKSYEDVFYGKDTEHIQGGIARSTDDNTQMIERFHGSLKQRTKVMRGLKNFETALDFTKGWLVHYNYVRPHESLNEKTPAEIAGIPYPYQNWADIIRLHNPTIKHLIEHQPRTAQKILPTRIGRIPNRLKASMVKPKVNLPKHQGRGIFMAKDGRISRRHFRGSRRIR